MKLTRSVRASKPSNVASLKISGIDASISETYVSTDFAPYDMKS